jgi:hypothetical protein
VKRTTLFNHHVAVILSEQVDEQATAEARMTNKTAAAVRETIWTVTLTDRQTGDQIMLPLAEKGRDGLVKELLGTPDLVVPKPTLYVPGS